MPATRDHITRLLIAIREGDDGAEGVLIPLVYDELRSMARGRLRRGGSGATVRPTELVHEAYLRLLGPKASSFESRAHFFGAASEAMRRVLIDRARMRYRKRRGEGRRPIALDQAVDLLPHQPAEEFDLLALDESLRALERLDARMARVVVLRVFGGVSIEDTARMLCLSERTIKREWACARAWLAERLGPDFSAPVVDGDVG